MAKEIFHTTEKSNFILNLTEEKYAKIASFGLLAALFTTSLATAIPVITHDKGLYVLSAAGLAASGVLCMIFAIIALIKKYINGKLTVPAIAFGAMLLWGVVSLTNSYDINIGFYGYPGRGEGLLAIAFYGCFFITAASVRRSKVFSTLIYGLTIVGLLNSVFGLIQVFAVKLTDYRLVSSEIQINAAAGLSQSPLFLAMVLTLSLIASLIAFINVKGTGKKLFFIISSCIFSFTMMFTYSLIGVCGVALAAVIAVVSVFVFKANKLNILSALAAIVPAIAAVIIVNAGLIGTISQYKLYDGRILWFADAYYRLSASGEPDIKNIDIEDTYDVYYTLNRKALNAISAHGLTGTGPDQLVFPQLYTLGPAENNENIDISDVIIENKGTFDKVYNEYLYTAATRGIPSLIALAAVLLSVLALGKKNSKNGTWTQKCMFILTITSVLIFLIGCSNTAFSPIFWTIAGCTAANVLPDKEAAVPAKEKSESDKKDKDKK